MKKSTVILGGNGFLGKNITKEFLESGCTVKVYDIAPPVCPEPGVEYIVGDLWDKESLENAIAGADVVIHLASSCTPQSSMVSPKNAFIDIELAEEICSVCNAEHVGRIIYASSGGTIYGDIGHVKATEDMQTWPINYYAISKITIEKILMMYNRLYGMENVILRVSNPYGRGQSPEAKVGAVAVFTHLIKEGKPVVIYGDGNVVRDYVRVEDVAHAFRLAADWNNRQRILPVFNIGSGEGVSVGSLPHIISDVLGKDAAVSYKEGRNFDIEYNVLDIEKASDHLGYCVSADMREGIRRYIQMYA